MDVNLNTLNLHEPEFKRIKAILDKVQKELRADIVLLVSQSGQPIVILGVDRTEEAIEILKKNWVHTFSQEIYAL